MSQDVTFCKVNILYGFYHMIPLKWTLFYELLLFVYLQPHTEMRDNIIKSLSEQLKEKDKSLEVS